MNVQFDETHILSLQYLKIINCKSVISKHYQLLFHN